MSSSLSSVLRALHSSRYLLIEQKSAPSRVVVEHLLPLGQRFCEQLAVQWLNTSTEGIPMHITQKQQQNKFDDKSFSSFRRLAFLDEPHFRENLEVLRKKSPTAQYSAVLKSQLSRLYTSTSDSFIQLSSAANATYLVSDYFFFKASRGLEKFYNIQRERKIWWMRLSANPSRYFLDPFDFSEEENESSGSQCQSITIKSRFPFGVADVEHVTLVPLCNAIFEGNFATVVNGESKQQPLVPAVIRSVIHLENAACAMFLDGYDHNRNETLLLNRKLVPYQCTVACLYKGDNALVDLQDLCTHISLSLRSAGLRLLDDTSQSIFTNSKIHLNTELQAADRVGIPYAMIVEEDSLRTGLLKLRNRDTTLAETIHISDIPSYLLKIFAN